MVLQAQHALRMRLLAIAPLLAAIWLATSLLAFRYLPTGRNTQGNAIAVGALAFLTLGMLWFTIARFRSALTVWRARRILLEGHRVAGRTAAVDERRVVGWSEYGVQAGARIVRGGQVAVSDVTVVTHLDEAFVAVIAANRLYLARRLA